MNNISKCLLIATLTLIVSDAFSAAPLSIKEQKAKRAALEKAEYMQTGGYLKRPGTQKGRIVYLNCQTRVDQAVLSESAANLQKELQYGIDVEKGVFDIAAPKLVGDATLFVVDDEKLPKLLGAPEDKWAMVNVSHLVDNDPEVFRSRVSKELSRGMVLLAGGFLSQFQMTLTECVTTPAQLDKYHDWRLPFDTLQKMKAYLKGYGIQPFESVSYRDACYEGWAPPPKDEVQKTIMKEEKAYREKDKAKAASKK